MMLVTHKNIILFAALVFALFLGTATLAQEQTPTEAPVAEQTQAENVQEQGPVVEVAENAPDQAALQEKTFDVNQMPSILFTYWEHTAIKDAKRARGLVRPPTEEELARELRNGPQDYNVKPPPEERDISLGGIVYVARGDWTIWLNGQRVTPTAIPEEVMDLKVFNEYVEFKWFDTYTNQIFPIRLRPHQRFNIDTRIFLPG